MSFSSEIGSRTTDEFEPKAMEEPMK